MSAAARGILLVFLLQLLRLLESLQPYHLIRALPLFKNSTFANYFGLISLSRTLLPLPLTLTAIQLAPLLLFH